LLHSEGLRVRHPVAALIEQAAKSVKVAGA
jgi:hypothetical protein